MAKQLPLTGIAMGAVSPGVIVCGDSARAGQIASRLSEPRLLSDHREYRAFRGRFEGVSVTVCSHGIGAPGAAIAFEELIAAGGRRLIRVGSCGSLQQDIDAGSLIIATAAVQHTGYGRETVPDGYPAVADPELCLALRQVAAEQGHPCHSGIVLTRDNFYAGVRTAAAPDYHAMSAARVLAVEMECAALFIVGALRQVQTAAILAVDGKVLASAEEMESYNPHQDIVAAAIESEIEIALFALSRSGAELDQLATGRPAA